MHPFHDHLARQLSDKLKKRRVVLWYDERLEFVDFIEELSAAAATVAAIHPVKIGTTDATLARFSGAVITLRLALEQRFSADFPDPLLVYLPGIRSVSKSSMLLELELAGERIGDSAAWSLRKQARVCLSRAFTDGKIDQLLASEGIAYGDIVSALRLGGDGDASPLKLVFPDMNAGALIARWIADPATDLLVESRGAAGELHALLASRLGVPVTPGASLGDTRRQAVRHVLLAEFRSDLAGAAPASLATVPLPTGDALRHARDLAQHLRAQYDEAYERLAKDVQEDFGLASLGVAPEALGRIDTFRFEEELLLQHAVKMATTGDFEGARRVAEGRRRSFWVDRHMDRQLQWQACTLTADLGLRIAAVRAEVARGSLSAEAMVRRYADDWYTLDRLHRETEERVAGMEDDPVCDPALRVVRRAMDDTLELMAKAFSGALRAGSWNVPGILHQTRIYSDVVATRGGTVAWFWVDALRYEMGAELAAMLSEAADVRLVPAVVALPSITPVGMAALLPGASSSFSVGEHAHALASFIDGIPMPDLHARLQYLRGRVPGVKDMPLQKVLDASPAKLRGDVEAAPLVVIRSQEIDKLGETDGGAVARVVMGTVVGNLARAVRKLAAAGIEHFVLTADHGHQFALRKDTDMTTDRPGGQTLELHRRCWIGRGGQTPPSTVRVRAADLGYESDLDFVFPIGTAVFPTGGDLRFHHGSTSLQEMIIPVLSLRMPARTKPLAVAEVRLHGVPARITNRVFMVRVEAVGLYPRAVRVVCIHGEEHAGEALGALEPVFDAASKVVRVAGGATVNVGVMLGNPDANPIRVLVLDADTGATLIRSDEIPVQLGI